MKRLLLFVLVLSLSACGNDDAQPKFEGRLPKTIHITANYAELNQQIAFTYDSRHRLATMTIAGDDAETFTYSYNNRNQVTGIAKQNGDDLVFEYNSDGRLSGYTEGNVDHEIVYNSGTQSYAINGYSYVLKDNGDILTESGMVYHYDTFNSYVLKGCFRDVVGSSYQLTSYLAYNGAVIYTAKDAFTGRSVPADPNSVMGYSFAVGYDFQDYPISISYDSYGLHYAYAFSYYSPEEL